MTTTKRPISEISYHEAASLWDAVMPKACKPFKGAALKLKADEKTPERICLMSGVDRLGVYFTGKIWADCDLTRRVFLDPIKVKDFFDSIGMETPTQTLP